MGYAVQEKFGTAKREFVPFSDAQTKPFYRISRYEGSRQLSSGLTERGAKTVKTRAINDLKSSRSESGVSRVVDEVTTEDGTTIIYYRDRLSDGLRFCAIQIHKEA